MFSSLRDLTKRNFSLRLTLWYAGFSFLAYIVIFALAYHSLRSSLVKEDEKAILSKFKEYSDVYQNDALLVLQARIASERASGKPTIFLVRVAEPDNSTLLLSLPDQLRGLDLQKLGPLGLSEKVHQIRARSGNTETLFEIFSFPLPDGNFMQIGKGIDHREELLDRFRRVFFAAMVPAILIGLVWGYLAAFRALKPIRRLTATVASITETGEIGARVPAGKIEDEMGGLVALFNGMLGRIESLITGMKESLDSVAHDLRTPMARFRGLAERALQSNQGLDACREALSKSLEESERILRMLNILMDISEAKAGTLRLDKEEADVSVLVEEAVDVYRYIAEEKGISICTAYSGKVPIWADATRLRQALGNLLDNAVKYTQPGGTVDVTVQKRQDGEAVIGVSDNGIGIAKEDLHKIWDRLYRGDHNYSQRGLGLGLSLVKSIVELHGGRIEVSSAPGIGSTFVVCLPTAR